VLTQARSGCDQVAIRLVAVNVNGTREGVKMKDRKSLDETKDRRNGSVDGQKCLRYVAREADLGLWLGHLIGRTSR
jgi:hypothetical protein